MLQDFFYFQLTPITSFSSQKLAFRELEFDIRGNGGDTQTIKKSKKFKKLYLFFNPVLLIISLFADASTYILIIAVKTKFSLSLAKKK